MPRWQKGSTDLRPWQHHAGGGSTNTCHGTRKTLQERTKTFDFVLPSWSMDTCSCGWSVVP